MKKVTALLFVLVFCVSLCACQPTPDKPFVQSKNDGKLESAVHGDANDELENGYEVPEDWVETIESNDGIMVVNIDAKFTIPNVSKFPVYRVNATDITVDDAKAFIQAFAGDETLYTIDTTRTKAAIEAEIERQMEYIAEFDDPNSDPGQKLASGAYTQEDFDYYLNEAKAELAALQEEYKAASVDSSFVEMDYQYHDIGFISDTGLEPIAKAMMGLVMHDGNTTDADYFHVQTDVTTPYARNQVKYFNNHSSLNEFDANYWMPEIKSNNNNWQADGESVISDSITYEEAKAIADEAIYDKLKYDNYSLNRVCYDSGLTLGSVPFSEIKDQSDLEVIGRYVFIYTPTVDDIPVLFYSLDDESNTPGYAAETFPHFVVVSVKSSDNYFVREQSTMKIGEQLNSNVELLPFEEIQDIFRRYILMAPDVSDDFWDNDMENNMIERATFNITDVRLGYVRILEKDNIENGLLVPVWNFYGMQVNKYKEGYSQGWQLDKNNEKVFYQDAGNAFLCINAIDGSVIDLNLGY